MKFLRKNIRRVAACLLLLFVILAGYGAYSYLTYGNRWFASNVNTFVRQKKKDVIAGNVYDRSGELLASTQGENRVYSQDEHIRRCMVHVLGDPSSNVSNGAESFMARYLYGFEAGFMQRAGAYFRGEKLKGDRVQLSVDSRLMGYAASVFPKGFSGAVVVMNYETGEVLCELSFPNFDPHHITDATRDDPEKPFFNRAVQGLYTPGSTFKIVTAVSGLENIPNMENVSFQCTGLLQVGDQVITDAGTDLTQNKIISHGQLTLKRAFQVSCNNTFAQLALTLGDETLRKTSEKMGFNVNFLFRDLVVENSSYPKENRTEREVAWTGAGQSALLVSPMHMCMITSAVANDGMMMEPRILLSAVGDNGKVRETFKPREFNQVMTKETAAIMTEYMKSVVDGGTGQKAQAAGYRVCGKTGSAEVDGQEKANAWFTGFLDEENAPYAVTVVIENAGGGGSMAAPVAGNIFRYLLRK